jgi:TolB-like protein
MLKTHFVTTFTLFLIILLSHLPGCTYRMAFGGCEYRTRTGECPQKILTQDANLIESSYQAADNLIRNNRAIFKPKSRLLITTIADIDNLEDSTSLGRLLGEQLATRFAQRGYTVIEAKLQNGLFMIPQTGEFILSHQLRDLGQQYQANTVVAGTYAVAKDKVYLTLKMLDCKSSEVISSYAYTLPLGSNTLTLLQKSFWWW